MGKYEAPAIISRDDVKAIMSESWSYKRRRRH